MGPTSKDQVFHPTPAMRLFAFQKAKLGKNSKDKRVCALIGVRPETVSRWKHINGYGGWLEEQIAVYRAPIHDLLEQVALDHLQSGDFRFWDAMATKYQFKINSLSKETESKLVIDLGGSHAINSHLHDSSWTP